MAANLMKELVQHLLFQLVVMIFDVIEGYLLPFCNLMDGERAVCPESSFLTAIDVIRGDLPSGRS
jgi:hypothetical protein